MLLAAVLVLCLFSFVLLHFSGVGVESDLSINSGATAISVAGAGNAFRLFGRKKDSEPKEGLIELIVDDYNLDSSQKHFSLLRANGERADVGFLAQRSTTAPFSQTSRFKPSAEFIHGLNLANLIFDARDSQLKEALEYQYNAYEKELPYVGSAMHMSLFDQNKTSDRPKLLNSLAVFPSAESLHLPLSNESSSMHGALGWNRYGEHVWKSSPMPLLLGDPAVCSLSSITCM